LFKANDNMLSSLMPLLPHPGDAALRPADLSAVDGGGDGIAATA
jgi:hypothetical protein